jgi:hypothetical protein
MSKKLLVLSLALVLSFSLVAFAGCKGLPQEEIDQVTAGAAAASYGTFSFDTDIPITIKLEGGSNPGTIAIDIVGTGAVDITNQAMQTNLTAGVNVPDSNPQTVSSEIYVLEGWMYTGMTIPGSDEQWAKIALTDPMWQQQDQLGLYLKLLETAVEVKYKGTETANNVECYVFEIEPDMAALNEVVLQAASTMGMMDLSTINLTDLYKELSVKEWVAKEDYRLQRAEVSAVLQIHPEDVGLTSDSFEKMTLNIGTSMRFYAYDQPFNVVLPAGAQTAEEVSASS